MTEGAGAPDSKRRKPIWPAERVERLRQAYAAGPVNLDALSNELGVHRSAVAAKASRLGLTNGRAIPQAIPQPVLAPIAGVLPEPIMRSPRQPGPRRCLECRSFFASEGAHNRVCPTCTCRRRGSATVEETGLVAWGIKGLGDGF